jgi:hypothetical protein
MADPRHEQTLAHLRLLAGLRGYWELRALRRAGANHMMPRGSFWIVATATADGLLHEHLDQALAWADAHDRQGTELFVGVNGGYGAPSPGTPVKRSSSGMWMGTRV